MSEATCPNCAHHFRLPDAHGTNPRWVGPRPKPSGVKILRALRTLGALGESTAIPRAKVALWLMGQGENYKVQNITSRASELVTLELAEKVEGDIQETVDGVLRWRRKPLWYITAAGVAYLERGEQAPLVGVEA